MITDHHLRVICLSLFTLNERFFGWIQYYHARSIRVISFRHSTSEICIKGPRNLSKVFSISNNNNNQVSLFLFFFTPKLIALPDINMSQAGRQSFTDKAGSALKPDSQKSTTEHIGDKFKGNMDSAASTVQPNVRALYVFVYYSYLFGAHTVSEVGHPAHGRYHVRKLEPERRISP